MLPQIDRSRDEVILLFTDTLIEDEDLYRVLDQSESYFGIPITRLADGRREIKNVWPEWEDWMEALTLV